MSQNALKISNPNNLKMILPLKSKDMKKLAPIYYIEDCRMVEVQLSLFSSNNTLCYCHLNSCDLWKRGKKWDVFISDVLFKRLYFIRVWSHNTYLRPLRILYPSRNNPYELLPPSLSLNPLLPRVICALYKRNWWIVSLLKDLWRNGRNTPWNCMLHTVKSRDLTRLV